jgi:hypothetical protein
MVIEAVSSLRDDDDSDDPGGDTGFQITLDDYVKPANWPEGKNSVPISVVVRSRCLH